MKLLATVLLVWTLQGDRDSELSELRGRGATIEEQEDAQEITTEQARRKVQLLLKDFEAWAEAYDVDLELKSRAFTSSADDGSDFMAVDRCALFYENDADALCLVDLKRSEVWGASVLFCRYLCE